MIRRNRPSCVRSNCEPCRSRRAGFSLIELMVVIVIIGILGAFLLAAVQNVQVTARNTTVIADIKNLEKAIADFKLKFGTEPPSFIVLCEKATDWTTATAQVRYSRGMIRELWPSYDFASNGDPTGTTASGNNITGGNLSIDINGDGDETDILMLNGAECLAFFLGGLQQPQDTNGDGSITAADKVAAKGFSSNPTSPFLGYTGNRIGPFYEFSPSRFVDTDATADKVWEYIDPLPGQTMPYLYFSSYGGKGYRVNGLDNTAGNADDETLSTTATQVLKSVYMQTPGNATSPAGPYKENSYQIISPGLDGSYGLGGFAPVDGVKANPTPANDPTGRATYLQEERDNLTNFKGGPLG